MSMHLSITLHVNSETLPEDVNEALKHFSPTPKGAASRYGSGSLTNSVDLSYDLFSDHEEALIAYGWTHVAGIYWVSNDNLLCTVRFS